MFDHTPGTNGPDPMLEGIDGQQVLEKPITMRGLYADTHAEILVELESIHRDIQHHQADGNHAAVSRLRVLEAHALDRLARIKSDAIADTCFGVRCALNTDDHSLRDGLTELLSDRFATKTDLEEIKIGLKFFARMFGRNS